ncbi:2-dehydro-3-deoxygalactonokinase [Aquincola sp. MAHUQ-54]|uniref:2-dehydro-3-deoxygalactonokinase n=1 Tax=Aquincola agrisoli TaxID=3119538 RepID=A0AAW9QAU1_9BURK
MVSTGGGASGGLVALDWGSTRLRAWRFDADGRIAEARSSGDGASRLQGGPPAFEAALRAVAGDWLADARGVIACGMAGSAHGWRDAGYVPAPMSLDALPARMVQVPCGPDVTVHIVPGVLSRDASGAPDVMRGEETQLVGLTAVRPALAQGALVVMPGTHCKWARLQDGRLVSFSTAMTGELFALLREHSVLSRLMAPAGAPQAPQAQALEAFDRGVADAVRAGGREIARLLFGVRARGLFDELAPAVAPDYLSGLLIGNEVASAGAPAEMRDRPVVLVGEAALCARYARALAQQGLQAEVHDEPLAAAGLARLAGAAGLYA